MTSRIYVLVILLLCVPTECTVPEYCDGGELQKFYGGGLCDGTQTASASCTNQCQTKFGPLLAQTGCIGSQCACKLNCAPELLKCDKCKCVTAQAYKSICMDINVACTIPNTTACKSGNQCVLNNWLMDGVPDCNDRSDEDPCYLKLPACPTTPPSTTTPLPTTTTPTTTTTTTTPTTTTTTTTPTTTTTTPTSTTTTSTTTTTPTTTTTTTTPTTTTTTPTTTTTTPTTTTTTPTTTTTTTTPTTTTSTTTTTPTTTTTTTTTTPTTTTTTPVPITIDPNSLTSMQQVSSLKPATCADCNCNAPPTCSANTMQAVPLLSKCNMYYKGVIFGLFQCKNGTGCVYYKYAMDGYNDCPDGSDENPLYWNECLLERDPCDRKLAICMDDVVNPLTPDGRAVCQCRFGSGSKDNAHNCAPIG